MLREIGFCLTPFLLGKLAEQLFAVYRHLYDHCFVFSTTMFCLTRRLSAFISLRTFSAHAVLAVRL